MITIVDYGMGNIGSLLNMFRRLGADARTESDPDVIIKSSKIVLPGVGSFDAAMQKINGYPGLREVLEKKALIEQIPILGICLGMQLMTRSSEEGQQLGLAWIPGRTRRFPRTDRLKVPHMGWNTVRLCRDSPLTSGIDPDAKYYFVHSYYVEVEDHSHALMQSRYGLWFESAICRGNIFGVQFHPEKSHRFGMEVLNRFAQL
jgi:glutamine amidotransferase